MVAETEDRIIGMIDIKENCHICLFFVDSSHQRKGVGRNLLNRVLAHCRVQNSELSEIDVHSSLFAVSIYEKLGFQQLKPEQVKNGIRFVEMIKRLDTQNS